MKAASDKLHFFLTCVKFLGHIFEGSTSTSLKSQTNAIIKLQPPANKKKKQDTLGIIKFISKFFIKMQLYLRPFNNILDYKNLRQQ